MNNKLIIPLAAIGIIILLAHLFFLNDFVIKTYNHGNPFIEYLFPRFSVERHRLPITFFMEKKNQVTFRLLLLIAILLFIKKPPEIKTLPISSMGVNIKAFFLFIFIFTTAWIRDIPDLINMSIVYQPVKILKVFSIPQPSQQGLYLLFSLTAFGAFYSILRTKAVTATLSLIGFILIQAVFSSYQKIDHGFTSLIYLGMTFCLFLFRKKELKNSTNLSMLIVSLCYFQAGLEKILTSQLELFNSDNILTHLTNHPTVVSNWLGNYPIISESLFLLVIFFQVSFPIILILPKLKQLYLIGGIAFHLGVYFFLGVGWWVSPWSLALLLLFDWSPVLEKLKLANKKYTKTVE